MQCASNIRQLVLAIDAYANDARDRYPPGAPDFVRNLTRWHGSRASASQVFQPHGGSLSQYLSDRSDAAFTASRLVRTCPVFAATAQQLAQAGIGFERSAGGYGYNNAYVGVDRASATIDPATGRSSSPFVTDAVGAARSKFATPSATLAFADAAFADGNRVAGIIEYSFAEPRFWPDNPAQRADPSIHFRHGAPRSRAATASIAWLDGHVSSEQRTFSWSSGVFAAQAADFNVGWFGAADTNVHFQD